MLALDRVGKTYPNGVHALEGITLEVAPGEIVAVVGGSGCGKSTLLRAVSGLDRPSQGAVALDGVSITAPHEKIGIVFQEPRLLPWLSVADNVGFGLDGRPKPERSQRVDAQLARVGLTDKATVWPRELSGGQAQRVALARVLAKRPRLLLLDEPMAALDRGLREHTRSELKRLHRELGTTFVLVTHDQEEALAMADRVALLEDGRLVQMGAPEDLYERPETLSVARFVGRINLLAGRAAGQGTMEVPVLGRVQIPAAIFQPGSALTLAIRPERIERGTFGPNVWPARVVDVTFLGDQMLYDMRLPGDIPLKALWPARSGAVARPGETITVGWPIAAALVFPE